MLVEPSLVRECIASGGRLLCPGRDLQSLQLSGNELMQVPELLARHTASIIMLGQTAVDSDRTIRIGDR